WLGLPPNPAWNRRAPVAASSANRRPARSTSHTAPATTTGAPTVGCPFSSGPRHARLNAGGLPETSKAITRLPHGTYSIGDAYAVLPNTPPQPAGTLPEA